MNRDTIRTRWAAVGAAVAITLGAGGVSLGHAARSSGERPVYVPLAAPCRLVDTRPGEAIGPKVTPIAAGDAEAYTIQVTGENGRCVGDRAVPADASAVALNVTAIAPVSSSGRSFFTVYPADASRPGTSNLNFVSGAPPTPNKVDVGLSDSGAITVYNEAGTAHAAVDVFGYYVDHDHDDRYYTKADVDSAVAAAHTIVQTSEGDQRLSVATSPFDAEPGTVVRSVTVDAPGAGWVTAHGSLTVTGTTPSEAVMAGCTIEFFSPFVHEQYVHTAHVENGRDAVIAVDRGLHTTSGPTQVNLVCRTYGGSVFPELDLNSVEVRNSALTVAFVPD